MGLNMGYAKMPNSAHSLGQTHLSSHCNSFHRSPVNSPHKGQWRGALMFSLICTRINSWVNNGEAGNLRYHRAHYDVTIMGVGSAHKLQRHDLTHWSWVLYICINKLNIIGSGNGLLPGWCEAIIWTSTGKLLVWPSGTKFNEMSMEINKFH